MKEYNKNILHVHSPSNNPIIRHIISPAAITAMEVEKGRGSEWSCSVLQNMTDDCVPFSFQCFQFYNRKDRMTKHIVSNWMALASALDSPYLGVCVVI